VYDLAPSTRDEDVPLTPEEIANKTFPQVVRGYDRAAVDEFLHEIAGEVSRLQAEAAQARPRADKAPAPAAPAGAAVTAGPAVTVAPPSADPYDDLGKNLAMLLRTAGESAARMRRDAEHTAETTKREADDAAESLLRSAEARAQDLVARAEEEA